MRIALTDITTGHRRVPCTLEADGAAVGLAVDGEVRSVEASLLLKREGRAIRATIEGKATIHRPCDRCGHDIDVEVEVDDALRYLPRADAPTEEEVVLSEDDLDVAFLEDDVLDTTLTFAEAFALALPVRVTCGAPACPHAAALEAAPAEEPAGHPAFAALKDLL